MLRLHSVIAVIAASLIPLVLPAKATTLTESFATDPLQHGWKIFGDTNLFFWDSTNQVLDVTWDSSQPNSYFYFPLGTVIARSDDFSLAFDLQLADIGVGRNTNKASSFSIGVGFLNLEQATQTNFFRGTGIDSPDLAELAYFWDSGFGATVWPTLVDTNSTFNFNSSSDYAVFALTPGDWYHISLKYTASNQTILATVTNFERTAGLLITQSISTNFTDYRLDTLSISSYSEAGQDPQFAGSVLAHGSIDNILMSIPAPPVQFVSGSFANGLWEAQFVGQTNWLYTLQRSSDLRSWTDASPSTPGQVGTTRLSETNTPLAHAFYRIRANR